MPDSDLAALARFSYEVGHLKRSKRTGWLLAGVRDPETVAEHTFRTAIIGYVLALLEGADPERTAAICLFHDLSETRTGDIPSVGKKYLEAADPRDVVVDQVFGLPSDVAEAVRGLVDAYVQPASTEAELAKDADKLECLLQAREYEAQGYNDVQPWIDTSAASLRSGAARRLGNACREVAPDQWWRAFVSSYVRPETAPRQAAG